MRLVAIRGAITVYENSESSIISATKEMLNEIISLNSILKEDVVSIFFTATKDLDSAYPAKGARELGFTHCALFCTQEMEVKNSLKSCIRVMVNTYSKLSQEQVKHIYLKGAKSLRIDIDNNYEVIN